MSGPPPKRDSQRRRDNKPASYGEAEAEVAGEAAEPPKALGFQACDLIKALWDALADSAEAKYYSEADWARVRAELWYGHKLIERNLAPGAQAWATFQAGLNDLLISPADKRRAGIELKPKTVDEDERAADEAVAGLATVLTMVPKTA
ncbi:MAG: hypothetical protein ACRDTI_20760 [Mycobacterium sp.]